MKYQVKLEIYEGPLDLLLRLLEREEISAKDVSARAIVEQFLNYFEETGFSDIEEGSRFLVLAAALLSLKACLLLPQPEEQEGGRDSCYGDDDQEGFPDTDFEDYLLIQEAAVVLDERAREWSLSYPRSLSLTREAPRYKGVQEDVSLLVRAFQDVLANRPAPPVPYTVESAAYDLEEAMQDALKRVGDRPDGLLFRDLFPGKAGKEEIIAIFLAVLELVFRGEIKVRQDRETGEIHLQRVGEVL